MADTIEGNNQLNMMRKYYRYEVKCPICGEKQKVGVEFGLLQDVKNFPFSHIYLHGEPLHALVVYLDKQFQVRGAEACASIDIKKESNTLQQVVKKWSNPF